MNKHITAKIGVGALIIKNNQILLSKKNYGITKGKWTFPEGYVDKNESPVEAIKREVKEELNGQIKVGDLVGIRYKKNREDAAIYFIFNCHLNNTNKLELNTKELTDFKFIDIEQAKKDPEVYSLVKVVLNKIRNKSKCNFKKVDFSPLEMKISKEDYFLYL